MERTVSDPHDPRQEPEYYVTSKMNYSCVFCFFQSSKNFEKKKKNNGANVQRGKTPRPSQMILLSMKFNFTESLRENGEL